MIHQTNIALTIAATVAITACSGTATPDEAIVKISNPAGKKIYFQPESYLGYTEITVPDTVITITGDSPCYYRLMDADGNFHQVFVTPGSSTDITVTDSGIEITGTNNGENRFLKENIFLCRTPDSIPSYSDAWVAFNENEIARLDSALDNSGLSDEFITTQKLYYRYTLLNQRLAGYEIARTFSAGKGSEISISDNYYDFLNDLSFNDRHILSIPKWFTIVNSAIEAMEKQGKITVDNNNYIDIYARLIENDEIRSAYVVNLLELTLKHNYLNDFAAQLETVRPYVTSPADIEKLKTLETDFAAKVNDNVKLAKGSAMPEMTFRTVDGKEYTLADFKGSVVVLDFWFTGCVPCRGELPYLEKIASDMSSQNVKFISVSLDTGDELYATWEKMMKEKDPSSKVISVNLPGGFTSPVLEELNIRGVPRMFIINTDGTIEDAYAKRPSDPKLRQQINTMLAK